MFRRISVAMGGCMVWLGSLSEAWSQPPLTRPQEELVAVYQKADLQEKQGHLKDALATLEPAANRVAATFGPDHRWTADFKIRLAELYDERVALAYAPKLGDQAEKLLLEAVQIRERLFGRDHDSVLMLLDALAEHDLQYFDATKAEQVYRQSLALREAKFGKDGLPVARSLDGLGKCCRIQARWQEADGFLQRSLQIRQAKLGADHPDVALSWIELGQYYSQIVKYDAAISAFDSALRVRTAKLDKNAPGIADVLEPMAQLYAIQQVNRADQVLPLYQRCLPLRETQWGPAHPKVVGLLERMATQYRKAGRLSEAFVVSDRALRIKQDQLPENDAAVERATRELAIVAGLARRWSDVARLTDASLHKFQQQELQGNAVSESIETVLRLALSLPALDPNQAEIADRSAEWLLNARVAGRQHLRDFVRVARDRGDAQLNQKVQRLIALRGEYATAALHLPANRADKQAWFNRDQQLRKQAHDLEREIFAAMAVATPAASWTPLEALRQAVPEHTVVVEMARFLTFDPGAKNPLQPWGSPRYAAWVIPNAKSGKVRMVDLGDAKQIDAAVQSLRHAIADAPGQITKTGEILAEQQLRKELSAVGRLVLQPLLETIKPYDRWILVPDNSLWLVPWSALTLPDGAYVVEQHQVSYRSSGLELLKPRSATRKLSPPLIVADPDYDFAPAGTTAKAAAATADKSLDAYRIGRVPQLPGTATEAAAVAPSVKRFAAVAPQVLTGAAAREEVVKQTVSPHTLIFSTHGFFLADPPLDDWSSTESSAITAPLTLERTVFSNPLMRCGVLLTGCNRRDDGLPAGTEDGVLTGLEVLGLDLRGTQLVVLSACETGLGQLQNSEGVSGLRQAFQLAGAEAVVATLWQIPDAPSTQLMNDFFANLAAGQSKADALRNAQLARMKARRDKNGAAHPFFWAAFTLTGQ